jgi:CheY-like chemotaxis protein
VKKLTSFQVCVGRAQDAGWRVLEADSADQALAMLRAGQQIDIVITDVQLKGAPTGWDVAEAFRAAHPGWNVVAEAATANTPFGSLPCSRRQ